MRWELSSAACPPGKAERPKRAGAAPAALRGRSEEGARASAAADASHAGTDVAGAAAGEGGDSPPGRG